MPNLKNNAHHERKIGGMYMNYTKQQLEEMMEENGGSLDLRGTQITALPENLTVGGNLYLSGTGITALPENLTVGGSLDLRGTQITALPENLTVGGWLDLSDTQITALPENLTVGGWLDLSDTGITVEERKKVKALHNGDYIAGRYLYCDEVLTHIKRSKKIGSYIFYIGKIKNKNVVSDGTYYAHCKTFKEGVLDIEFKKSKERGAEQYSSLTPESELTFEEAVTAYRIITGACRAGTQQFLDGLKEKKEKYTVSEIIEQTKGQYGNTTFADFFKRNE